MTDAFPRVSAMILAGGKSERMGRDKAFIEFAGKTLVERVIDTVRALSDDVLIVANDAEAFARFGVRVVGDVYPGKGSLGGIFSGLQAARHDIGLAVACDMPFLNVALMRHLVSLAPEFDVVIPRAPDPSHRPRAFSDPPMRQPTNKVRRRPGQAIAKESDLHPMHAVYAKSCLPAMQSKLLANDLRVIGFFDGLNVRIVEQDEIDRFDPKHLSFFNANTPEDIAFASSMEP